MDRATPSWALEFRTILTLLMMSALPSLGSSIATGGHIRSHRLQLMHASASRTGVRSLCLRAPVGHESMQRSQPNLCMHFWGSIEGTMRACGRKKEVNMPRRETDVEREGSWWARLFSETYSAVERYSMA